MDNSDDLFAKSADSTQKLTDSIKKFAYAFKSLTPAAKTAFQRQIANQMKNMDDRTKKLYETLIEATEKGLDTDKTISEMEKTDKSARMGI
jgi:hypothetical protein